VVLRGAVIADVAPEGSHSTIVYPMVAIVQGKNLEATKSFMAFLRLRKRPGFLPDFALFPCMGEIDFKPNSIPEPTV
jgi:hypothetical protein